MQMSADTSTCEDFHLIAAVFADGTVSGDLRWIDAIVTQRRQAYEDIAKANEILSAAISSGADAQSVIGQLTDWQKSSRPGGMAGRPSPTYGPSSGWQSRGTAPPPQMLRASPVPGAALWLIDTQKMTLPDAAKALGEWRGRLARLPSAAEPAAASAPGARTLSSRLFTPPSEPDLLGKPAPEFTLKDVDGREFTLAGLRGKPVLLDFWATWCAPCVEEMPHIQALYDQFKEKGLAVVCVDTNETAEKPRKFFEDHRYSFVNLLDSGEDAFKKYGAGAIPRTVLIDKDGIVRYAHRGWGTSTDLTPEVKKLFD